MEKGKQRSGHRQLGLAIKLVLEQTPINPPPASVLFHPLLPFSVNIHTITMCVNPMFSGFRVACQHSLSEFEAGNPSSNVEQ